MIYWLRMKIRITVGGNTAKPKAKGTFTGTNVEVLKRMLTGSFNWGWIFESTTYLIFHSYSSVYFFLIDGSLSTFSNVFPYSLNCSGE